MLTNTLFRIILVFLLFTFHCSSNISSTGVLLKKKKKKVGHYLGLGDFFTFFPKKCTVIILYVNSYQELKLLKAFV